MFASRFGMRAARAATSAASRGRVSSSIPSLHHSVALLSRSVPRAARTWPQFALGATVAVGTAAFGISVSQLQSAPANGGNKKTPHTKLPQNMTIIFVLGGPGAGKGTQCERLVKEYNFVHLSAGDLLRAERERPGSKYGDLINSYIVEGKIVPMEITIGLLEQAMLESGETRFLIDGFPRAMDQALAFERQIARADFVLYFECPEAEMEKRLLKRGESSGRADDNIVSIKKRFRTFVETSMPVIDHYAKEGRVRKLYCLKSVEEVYADVRHVITKELKLE